MKCIFLDLEMNTGGKVIEIGAHKVDLKQKKFLSEFSTYINPEEPITQVIMDLTGITDETVKDAPSAFVGMTNFWCWVDGSECGGNLAAWGKDIPYLIEASRRAGIEDLPKIREINFKEMFAWVRDARGGKHRGGLKNALEFAGIKWEGLAHRASVDAKMTGALGVWVYDIFKMHFEMTDVIKKHKCI